ncbi:hypothetical protein FHW37_101108 [Neorhizobium alkalisoli]|uniref:Uncharacterized protein n=1 Tax=Neorhizobium alkalisoli TaxID=528178 RepID=A0A561R6T9_9HYPH|nr:hypothetical protein FHW37_101108 [Neorhizobium alkalisoli]
MSTQSQSRETSISIEHWAMNQAHQIVVHQGMSLIEAAQCLDRKRTSANTYALRKAIMDCLVEALKQGQPPVAVAAE